MLPKKLQDKIDKRILENSVRSLGVFNNLIDFSSNDYLGFSKNKTIFSSTSEILKRHNLQVNGATGSRLLSGNHPIYTETESVITAFHNSDASLIFNSGYDANIGFFSSVPQRGDIILYDELCHASIRDGIKMSNAKSLKFKHNDSNDLKIKLANYLPREKTQNGQGGRGETLDKSTLLNQDERIKSSIEQLESKSTLNGDQVYVVTESVFSMDGDQPDLKYISTICKKYKAHLIVDEAHAIGVLGENGSGLVQELSLEEGVFARIITFGKAFGSHGAAILGGTALIKYLINFVRSFIYTTALPPHAVATIQAAHNELEKNHEVNKQLKSNIAILQNEISINNLETLFISSVSAIHSCIIPGNSQVKKISEVLKEKGFNVKPILSPTVPKGQERLRICIHSFNTEKEIVDLVNNIKTLLELYI